MTKSDSKKAKPTEADKRAARRLKDLWLAIPRDRRPTQDQMAEHWGDGGTQSLISQYMNGHIPLNLRAVLFFANELAVPPEEIYPDLPALDVYRRSPEANAPRLGVRAKTDTRYAIDSADLINEAHRTTVADVDREWSQFTLEQKQKILAMVKLAGVIGVTPAPRAPSQKRDAGLKQPLIAADLRRLRRHGRKAPSSGGKQS